MRKEIVKRILYKQKQLDQLIMLDNQIFDYPELQITIALYTKIGELSNEIPHWQYWKKNLKENKEKQLEKLADCIYFTASLMNHNNESFEAFSINQYSTISQLLCSLYDLISADKKHTMNILFELGNSLDFCDEEIEESYNKKNKINY